MRALFAKSLRVHSTIKEFTQVYRLHINRTNCDLTLKWLQRTKPLVFGFSYKLLGHGVMKVKIQMNGNQYIPLKVFDHSFLPSTQ